MFDDLRIRILGDNQTRAAFDALRREISGVQGALADVSARARHVGESLRSVGQTMSLSVTLPVIAGFSGILRAAGDFESAMNSAGAVTRTTGDTFDQLRDLARDMGATTRFSATEAANAIEMLGRNSVSAADIMGGALDATLKLASAAGVDLPGAADLATDVMGIFGLKAAEVAGVVDTVAGALVNSKFGFEDFALALGQGGGPAADAGLSLEEFATSIAAISPYFKSGGDAGTSFKTFLQRLVPATDEARREMSRLGLDFFDATGAMLPMAEIAGQLQSALSDLSDEQRISSTLTIFGTDAMRAASAMASIGEDKFSELAAAIGDVSSQELAEVRMRGLTGQMAALRSALEGLAISIADSGLLAFVTEIVGRGAELVRALGETNPQLLKLGVVAAAAAAAIGPGLIVLGALSTAIGALVSPVGLAVAGLAALGAAGLAISQNWGWFQTEFPEVAGAIKGLGRALREFASGISDVVMRQVAGLRDAFLGLVAVVEGVLVGDMEAVKAGAVAVWKGFGQTLSAPITASFDMVREAVARIWPAIKEEVASWPGKMWEAGADMMRGLRDGILGLIPDVTSATSSAGRNAARSLRESVDSNSPSKVFMGIGRDMMQGLLIGIRDGEMSVTEVMRKLGDGVSDMASRATQTQGVFQNLFTSIFQGADQARSALAGVLQQAAGRHLNKAFSALLPEGSGLTDALGSLLGFAKGGAFSGSTPIPFATGAVVSAPTVFGMGGGRMGVMGEAGPEGILPLKRVGGVLGVRAELPEQAEPMRAPGGHLAIDIAPSDLFRTWIRDESYGTSVRVMEQGLRGYDAAAPARQQAYHARGV